MGHSPPTTAPARVDRSNRAATARSPRRDLGLGLALIGLVLLAYLPALSGGFVWDDDAHLTANPCVVGPLGLSDIWTVAHMRICPLVQTTFWAAHRIWGLDPLPYHLGNVLLHAAAAVVLWRVLCVLRVPGAWLGAALWGLHPVQVESVAWVTEMKNTQSGLFFLLAVLCFCRSRRADAAPAPHGRAGMDYVLTLVFATLAMASKSSTVVLPLVLWLCAWWMERSWRWRRNLVQLAPLLLLSAVTGVLTIWTQRAEGAFDPEFARGFAERLADTGKVFWFYLGKLAWPHPLVFIYPRWRIDPASAAAYLPTLAAAGLVFGLGWLCRRGARSLLFALTFFVVALLPVLGLVDTQFFRYAFVADHFQYLASMGPLALAGAGLGAGLGTLGNPPRWLPRGIGALVLLTLGVLTWHRCPVFHDNEVLMAATLRLNPTSWMAHVNLGVELDRQPGRSAEAMAHYEEALRLRPRDAAAHLDLARDLARIPGRQADAIAHYEAALRIDPGLVGAHRNLAALLAAQPGRAAEAIAHYEQALRLDPDSAVTHYNLATELAKTPGREREAIAHYREALRLRPDLAEAHYNLALELARQPGGEAEAAAEFERALRLRPDWPEAEGNYALVLSNLPGRLPEALAHFERALRLRPNDPRAHFNFAGALYRAGRLADAIGELQTTLELDPNYPDARRNLVALQRQLRP